AADHEEGERRDHVQEADRLVIGRGHHLVDEGALQPLARRIRPSKGWLRRYGGQLLLLTMRPGHGSGCPGNVKRLALALILNPSTPLPRPGPTDCRNHPCPCC